MPLPLLVVPLLEGIGALLLGASGQILFALGVGFVTYQGMDTVLQGLQTYVTQSYAGLPSAIAGFTGLMQLDRAISIILGAVSARFVLAGISGGQSIKKMVWK